MLTFLEQRAEREAFRRLQHRLTELTGHVVCLEKYVEGATGKKLYYDKDVLSADDSSADLLTLVGALDSDLGVRLADLRRVVQELNRKQ